MSIYLDFNSTTPIDERVLDCMIDVYKHTIGNADSRTHDFGENAIKKERISPKILIFAPQCQSSDTENYLFI